LVGGQGSRDAPLHIGDGHRYTRHDPARLVSNASQDAPRIRL
jgi:hypothetical protein